MKKLRWVKPKLVAEIAFAEWTRDGHLRHSTFVGLREDKKPSEVVREGKQERRELSADRLFPDWIIDLP